MVQIFVLMGGKLKEKLPLRNMSSTTLLFHKHHKILMNVCEYL